MSLVNGSYQHKNPPSETDFAAPARQVERVQILAERDFLPSRAPFPPGPAKGNGNSRGVATSATGAATNTYQTKPVSDLVPAIMVVPEFRSSQSACGVLRVVVMVTHQVVLW